MRGIARDLSIDGMGAILFADLQVGDRVLIKYQHPYARNTGQTVARRAVVRGCFGHRYGFQFEQPLEFDEHAAALANPVS